MAKLTKEQRQDLLALNNAAGLIWGGLYGKDLPFSLRILINLGYAQEVSVPYTTGKLSFEGGYRITPAGRAALEATDDQ